MRAACRFSIRNTTAWEIRRRPAPVQAARTSHLRRATTEANSDHHAAINASISAAAACLARLYTPRGPYRAVRLPQRGGAARDCVLVCEYGVVCGPCADEADRNADH